MSETRQYEVVYVVSPDTTEEGVTELHERIAEIVGQLGGRIDKTDNWDAAVWRTRSTGAAKGPTSSNWSRVRARS